jgi:hypothetical protein
MPDHHADAMGSHPTGAETYNPLIDEAVTKLLVRQDALFPPVSSGEVPPATQRKSICFVGVANRSNEEPSDFRERVYEQIAAQILSSQKYRPVSRRYVDTALRQTRLRPESLVVPENLRKFAALLEQQGQTFDYLLYAEITSGSTQVSGDYQPSYLLTLDLINVRTGERDRESASFGKGSQKTLM